LKSVLIIFVLLLAYAGGVFGQVSMDSFNKEWSLTQQKLKEDLKGKKIVENKAKGLTILTFEDVLDNFQVRVDYTFNKEGQLTAKTITNSFGERDYKPLFDIFKNDAVKRYGSKFTNKILKGKNSLIWQPDENTRVFMIYGQLMVQYNILKNLKPKSGN